MEEGVVKTTGNTVLKGFTVQNLKEADRLLKSGKTITKIVMVF